MQKCGQATKRESDLAIQAEKDELNNAYLKKREVERKQKLAEYEAKLRAELAGDKYPTMSNLTKERREAHWKWMDTRMKRIRRAKRVLYLRHLCCFIQASKWLYIYIYNTNYIIT